MRADLERLFVYGTLADDEIRERIVGPSPVPREAVLRNYRLRSADGFFFVRRHEGGVVRGRLLELDAGQLARADEWEEVPVYRRVRVDVELPEGSCEAWVYERDDVEGQPVTPGQIAELDRERILSMLDDGG